MISEKKNNNKKKNRRRRREKIMSGQREYVTWSVTPRLFNSFFKSLRHQGLSHLPRPISTLSQHPLASFLWKIISPSAHRSQPGPPVLGSRVVRVQRHRATPSRNKNIIPGGEEHAPSQAFLSCFPGRRFKGGKSTNECRRNHRDHFRGNS